MSGRRRTRSPDTHRRHNSSDRSSDTDLDSHHYRHHDQKKRRGHSSSRRSSSLSSGDFSHYSHPSAYSSTRDKDSDVSDVSDADDKKDRRSTARTNSSSTHNSKIKKIYVKRLRNCGTDKEARKLFEGQLVSDKDYDLVIKNDTDLYDEDTNELIAVFRKRQIPQKARDLARKIYSDIDKRLRPSVSRNTAAGPFTVERMRKWRDDVAAVKNVNATQGYLILKNGKTLKQLVSVPTTSFTAGLNCWKRRNGVIQPMGFSKQFPEEFYESIPFFQAIDKAFKDSHYDGWMKNKKRCDTHRHLTIPGTQLSSVAINKNYQSSFHFDRGDFLDGWSTLTVIEQGKYDGGFLVFPCYRIAVDVREGDILINQSHLHLHGNSPIKLRSKDACRLSYVTYLKNGMGDWQKLKSDEVTPLWTPHSRRQH
jgi:hypothetical protein